MSLTVPPAAAMAVVACDRCGLLFPHTQVSESGAFCEPCRDARWRDERDRNSLDEAVG